MLTHILVGKCTLTHILVGKCMLTHTVYRKVYAHTQLSGEKYKHFVGVEYKPGRPNVE